MASDLQIEKILTLVRDTIKNNIGTKLTAIATEMGDGITLTNPPANNYSINELEAIPFYPFIQVLPNTSDVINGLTTYDVTEHSVIVISHVAAAEGRIDFCSKRAYRFARAIWEVIKENQTLSDGVAFAVVESINYQPMSTDGDMFIQEVWLNIKVQKCESVS